MTTVANLNDVDKVAWHNACISVVDTLAANLDPARVARALELAQKHAVEFGSDEPDTMALVNSGKARYAVSYDFLCPCKDAEKNPATCKHVLAVHITQQALLRLEAQSNTPESVGLERDDETAADFWEAEPEPLSPVDDLSILDVPEMPQPPAPPVTYNVDNPAGFNFKAKVGNMELWYTFHDTSDRALMARLITVLPQLQTMVEACEARYKAQQPKPPAAPLNGNGTLPASTQNGTHPTPPLGGNDTDASWCPHHQVHMDWHPANDRGPGWYSHRLGSGGYCRGGN